MSLIQSRLLRWRTGLEARLRALDQPSAAERFASPLPAFSPEEEHALLAWVRRRVEHRFSPSAEPFSPISLPDSWTAINLDVAFWVRGELRASMILAENLPLDVALERCTERALHDGRFRPLTADELPDLRIELTFFGPWQPLEERAGSIGFDQGYAALVDGQPRAWYLPMVHNALRFDTLEGLIESLLYRKGGLSQGEGRRAEIYTFPTAGYIEAEPGGGRAISLAGPLVKFDERIDRERMLAAALEWLLGQELAPGVLVSRRIPGQSGAAAIDWPRVAFAAAVLAESGVSLRRTDCAEAARRVRAFLDRELAPAFGITSEAKVLAATYAGLESIVLGDTEQSRVWVKRAGAYALRTSLSPIAELHLAKLRALTGDAKSACSSFDRLYREWEEKRDRIQLALFPELLPLALALFEATGDERFLRQAEAVGDWYVAHQNADGSFPFALGSSRAPYLRGSGKVLEVLACLPARYAAALERGFEYAVLMQYRNENLYHIRTEEQPLFLGGFRHDVGNREAWSDAAGHTILALVRSTKQ